MGLELKEKPTRPNNLISVNLDKKCILCGEGGAVNNGLCLSCNANHIISPDPKFYEEINDQQFAFAEEVEKIGKRLVERYHEHLADAETKIVYIFLKNTPLKNNRETWGRAKKISGFNAWMAQTAKTTDPLPEPFFVIEISWYVWKRLKPHQKVALVDHEFCHCKLNDKRQPITVGHDCEEFNGVVARHGLWSDDVRLLLTIAEQNAKTPLFESKAEEN